MVLVDWANTPKTQEFGYFMDFQVVCRRRLTGGLFCTNRAEAHGQLVLSPMRLPEQLRSIR